MTICKGCKYKIKCALLPKSNPIVLLTEHKLYKDCYLANSASYIKLKDGSKMLKNVLKALYPKYKWSVRSSHYAGGSSIHTKYIDPNFTGDVFQSYLQLPKIITEDREISSICDRFQEGNFNGMTDSYEYNDNVLGCTKYVFANRIMIDSPY